MICRRGDAPEKGVFFGTARGQLHLNVRRWVAPERAKAWQKLLRCAPPNALCKLPFPASVVNTDAEVSSIWCEFLTVEPLHSTHRTGRLRPLLCRIQGRISSWTAREGSQSTVADRIEQPCRMSICFCLSPQFSFFDRGGFVVLSCVGLTPGRSEWPDG